MGAIIALDSYLTQQSRAQCCLEDLFRNTLEVDGSTSDDGRRARCATKSSGVVASIFGSRIVE